MKQPKKSSFSYALKSLFLLKMGVWCHTKKTDLSMDFKPAKLQSP